MNMFRPVKATSIEEYFKILPKDRLEDIKFLDSFIKKAVPDLKPNFIYNMLGYGSFKYKNYKREIIDWPILALANQKNYISLYVCSLEKGKYLAEKYKDKLGKVDVGKSCIRFKKIEDLNIQYLKEILLKASQNPGLAT